MPLSATLPRKNCSSRRNRRFWESTSIPPQIDLSEPLRVHVVGVGGAGMSAIAAVLVGMGHHTTGSDIKSSQSMERLGARGVEVKIGHRPENVVGADALTYSTA